MNKPPLGNIHELLGIACPIKIVDIGANPIDGNPPYLSLVESGHAQIVGFEPNRTALAELNRRKGPKDTYLPHTVADGRRRTLHHCLAPGMDSLFEPNRELLALFHNFTEWSGPAGTEDINTVRLDDIPEAAGLDFLKIDIQGAELMVFEHGTKRLNEAVAVHTEVEFLPMYIGQPLYADVDQFLRKQGFMLLRFEPMYHRTLKPVDPYSGLNQLLWADAIFIRDLTKLEALSPEKLLKLAVILHECYRAYDVALHVLSEYDRKSGARLYDAYTDVVRNVHAKIAFYQTVKN